MYYYFVWVRSNRYHGDGPLTYSLSKRLPRGSIVEVPLQKTSSIGFVVSSTTKPRFQTKDILKVYDLPPLPAHLLRLGLWLKSYYPAPIGATSQQLLPVNLSPKALDAEEPLKYPEPDLKGLPKLTEEQTKALELMTAKTDTYILHGRTGSGKTRLYIELAAKAIDSGKSAIILTPEISLTTQLADSFQQVFGSRVIVLHSKQGPSERQKAWLTCLKSTKPLVLIGPRSALFAPLKSIGLIVLDESHESAYKQEQTPQYQAGRVAAYLASLTKSSLILGSATPSVSDYYLAQQKSKAIIELSHLARPNDKLNSDVIFVDRKDHSLFSRSPYLSQQLIQSIETSLANNEQSLLYLNRRGTARLVLCENCGWQATCPNCDIPLTYHGDRHELHCHSCNYHTDVPTTCPVCGFANVVFKTAGTKAIVDDVKRIFPSARIARFDTDNLKAERFEQHYEAARDGKIDILIGTQMLAKGLDLPKLSTLGILLADTSLYLPDFSAQERTFQLILQVLGRIGRGHVEGRAVIQTYYPDHAVLRAAVNNDYQAFYKAELASRHDYLFPPFCYLLKLSVRRASLSSAEQAAMDLKETIERGRYRVRVEGPAPSFYERLQGKYQWQLVVKARDRQELLKIIASLPTGWSYDIDPLDLL
jgi:primosomal protein N' (replication factor Y) (superfamily II helicase)